MGLDTIMVREMYRINKGKGARMICGDIFGNIDPYIEWIKWLSYEPDFILEKIEIIADKKASEITESELNLLKKYKEDEKMARLFKMYGTEEITEDEYVSVYKYMKERSIENLMLRKLTKDELKYAKEQIKYYVGIPAEELSEKVKIEQKKENYEKLSMVDSYILHMISKTNSIRAEEKFNRELEAKLEANDIMLAKSYEYAKKNII